MTRTVERLEGLALVGQAPVGPLRVATPALAESAREGPPGPGLELRSAPARPGGRHLVLSRGEERLDLEFPVAAPEIVGVSSGISEAAPTAFVLHAPIGRDAADALRSRRPELLILGNARALWADGRPFIEAVRDIRSYLGAAPVLWTPRVALPHRLPLLAYLGVDLVDSTEGLLAAAAGAYLDPALGTLDPDAARAEPDCACPGCAGGGPGALGVHALEAYRRAMREVRLAARAGRLRELVEARLPAEPALAEMLRYADRDMAGLLDERTPVVGTDLRAYVVAESHRRPEMARFRDRLIERYRPPPSKSVLLLVPCSKRKPYRTSRSHRRFLGALEGLRGLERLHVVSVSSPIGLVPRELEDLPPARHYDIPVTGEWSGEEREMVGRALDHLVRTGTYRAAVVHLDPAEYPFLRDRFPSSLPTVWTLADDRTTSPEGLAALREAVDGALGPLAPVAGGPLAVVREELREVAAVQFGRAAADRLFAPPLRLAGRPWFQRLSDGRGDLATLREERGLFHLTIAGARRLCPSPPLSVEVDPSLPLTGDLFVPGVRAASERIRPGDSVVLLRDGRLAGVGEAVLPGRLMTELGHGLAVRVRHREHEGTDTAMTEEESRPERGPVV